MGYSGTVFVYVSLFFVKTLCGRFFGENVRDDYAAGQLDAQVCMSWVVSLHPSKVSEHHQVEGVLQEMRELSICGGN